MLTKAEFYKRFTTVLPAVKSPNSDIYFAPISIDGLEEMHRYSVNDRFYEYYEYPAFQNISETERYIGKMLERMKGDENSRVTTYWFVRRATDDRLIGTAVLVDLNFSRQSIEWGYGVDPDLWGNGYVLKIQEALKDYVFNVLELNRVHGVTMVTNLRTIDSIKAAGMAHEGIAKEHYCKDGIFIDGWRYGMTRSMYENLEPISGAALNGRALLSSVVSLVASVFPEEEITEETSMTDTDSWDSLGHMQVIIALNEEMNIELSPSDISEATSIEAIVKIIDNAT